MATSAPRTAIWFAAASKAAGKKQSSTGSLPTLYINCHIKPGASKAREGVMSVDDEAVEICVSAPPREGEANKAVVKVLSEVLDLPKSDLQITQGHKSRAKTVAVDVGSWAREKKKGQPADEEECLRRVRAYLDKAAGET